MNKIVLPKDQKFHHGDYVQVVDTQEGTVKAIVLYSYSEEYSPSHETYSIYIKGSGAVSWFDPEQMTLIERGREDLLKQWKKEEKKGRAQKSDLDWIFSHGTDVLENGYGASIQALASCFGLTNLWGKNGEGFTYYENSMRTLSAAAPYLQVGDKTAWLSLCEEAKSGRNSSSQA